MPARTSSDTLRIAAVALQVILRDSADELTFLKTVIDRQSGDRELFQSELSDLEDLRETRENYAALVAEFLNNPELSASEAVQVESIRHTLQQTDANLAEMFKLCRAMLTVVDASVLN